MAARQARDDGSEGDARERLLRRGREMRDEGVALADAVRGAAQDLVELSRTQLERNLYLTLGSAFALGYVLGGGLPGVDAPVFADLASMAASGVPDAVLVPVSDVDHSDPLTASRAAVHRGRAGGAGGGRGAP